MRATELSEDASEVSAIRLMRVGLGCLYGIVLVLMAQLVAQAPKPISKSELGAHSHIPSARSIAPHLSRKMMIF
jgi:hypothetical protein